MNYLIDSNRFNFKLFLYLNYIVKFIINFNHLNQGLLINQSHL